MKPLLCLLLLALAGSCNATYTVAVQVPYCPSSDSAKAKADSVPLGCVLPDSVRR